jgi:hypothetical protein
METELLKNIVKSPYTELLQENSRISTVKDVQGKSTVGLPYFVTLTDLFGEASLKIAWRFVLLLYLKSYSLNIFPLIITHFSPN